MSKPRDRAVIGDESKLGPLNPGTLVLVLFDHYPYWPSVVLSRNEAYDQPALLEQLSVSERSKSVVCAVRFLAANTCAIVQTTSVEPLVAGSKDHRSWIWRSSLEHQKIMGWPAFAVSLQEMWTSAYDEAEKYAASSAEAVATARLAENAFRGSGARQVGYLPPGTIVWACLQDSPIWPAKVCGMTSAEHFKLRSKARQDETEPLLFFNDPGQASPLYTSTHSCYGFTSDSCWMTHMRQRTIEMIAENGSDPKKISRKLWKEWEDACKEAFIAGGSENLLRRKKIRQS